jgi:hypothetical protein
VIDEGIWKGWEQIPEGYRRLFGDKTVIAREGFFSVDGSTEFAFHGKTKGGVLPAVAKVTNPTPGRTGPKIRAPAVRHDTTAVLAPAHPLVLRVPLPGRDLHRPGQTVHAETVTPTGDLCKDFRWLPNAPAARGAEGVGSLPHTAARPERGRPGVVKNLRSPLRANGREYLQLRARATAPLVQPISGINTYELQSR